MAVIPVREQLQMTTTQTHTSIRGTMAMKRTSLCDPALSLQWTLRYRTTPLGQMYLEGQQATEIRKEMRVFTCSKSRVALGGLLLSVFAMSGTCGARSCPFHPSECSSLLRELYHHHF